MGLEAEEWRGVDGTRYEVSSRGRVRRDGHVIRQFADSNGYRKVNIHLNGSAKQVYVHRLVACAFCGGYAAGLVVDHIDGDTSNNKASNLRWVTQKKNVWDSFKRGKQRRAPRPVVQVKDGRVVASYDSVAEAFERTGIRHISEAANGKRLTAGGFCWEYERA